MNRATRTVMIRLDPDMPRPEERPPGDFAIPNLDQWIIEPWHPPQVVPGPEGRRAMTNEQLAELARERAELHPPRTPKRRAAAALYVALADTRTPDAARRALAFTGQPVRADALAQAPASDAQGTVPGAPRRRPSTSTSSSVLNSMESFSPRLWGTLLIAVGVLLAASGLEAPDRKQIALCRPR
jgi:hypothetical protein